MVYAPIRKVLPTVRSRSSSRPGRSLKSSSLSTNSARPVRKFRRVTGSSDSARYEFKFRCVKVSWLRPQIRLDDQLPPGRGLVSCSDAVDRTTSPGDWRSGWASLPAETCTIQFFDGKKENRVDQELMGPVWMIQRFSPGSVP